MATRTVRINTKLHSYDGRRRVLVRVRAATTRTSTVVPYQTWLETKERPLPGARQVEEQLGTGTIGFVLLDEGWYSRTMDCTRTRIPGWWKKGL
eukprot:scaffold13986_cov17-Prasinocladus_malaysianus.AAC.1